MTTAKTSLNIFAVDVISVVCVRCVAICQGFVKFKLVLLIMHHSNTYTVRDSELGGCNYSLNLEPLVGALFSSSKPNPHN